MVRVVDFLLDWLFKLEGDAAGGPLVLVSSPFDDYVPNLFSKVVEVT